MIRTTFNGNTVTVSFEETMGRGTHCTIENLGTGESLSGGVSLHYKDQGRFNRAYGRKEALRRALIGAPRDLRSEVWGAYLAMCKVPTPTGNRFVKRMIPVGPLRADSVPLSDVFGGANA